MALRTVLFLITNLVVVLTISILLQIATAAGLLIAIMGLLPYNVLNAQVEEARHNITDAANALELNIKKEAATRAPFPMSSRAQASAPV